LLPDLGVRPGAQPRRHVGAHLDAQGGAVRGHGRRVRVGGDELDALEARLDQAVGGVGAAAAETYDADDRVLAGAHRHALTLPRPAQKKSFMTFLTLSNQPPPRLPSLFGRRVALPAPPDCAMP